MLLIELVCLLKSNLPKTRLLSCNLRHYLLPPFFRVLFAWLCFDDFLRLLLLLIFSPAYHLPKLWAPQGLGASRRKEQLLLSVKAGVCPQSSLSHPELFLLLWVLRGLLWVQMARPLPPAVSHSRRPSFLSLPSLWERHVSPPGPDCSHSVWQEYFFHAIAVQTQAQRDQTQIFWLQVKSSHFWGWKMCVAVSRCCGNAEGG